MVLKRVVKAKIKGLQKRKTKYHFANVYGMIERHFANLFRRFGKGTNNGARAQ